VPTRPRRFYELARLKAMRGRIALLKHFVRNLLVTYRRYGDGRGCGVGRGRGTALGVAVAVGVAVGVAGGVGVGVIVGVAVGVTVGVSVGVAVGVTVGVGVGGVALGVTVGVASDWAGAWTLTEIGEPVLKNPMFAVVSAGGAVESNRKLYNVPKRIALAFWFCANVSQFQVADVKLVVKTQGSLLYPPSPWVPSFANPGCCGGAWNPTLFNTIGGKKG
jgi:hypothetical protein